VIAFRSPSIVRSVARLAAATAIGLATSAFADGAKVQRSAPAVPQLFAWIEGGYSSLDRPRVHAFDLDFPTGTDIRFFDIDKGWQARSEAGLVFAAPFYGVDAISFASSYRDGRDGTTASVPLNGNVFLTHISPTGIGTSVTAIGPASVAATQKFNLVDAQVRFKHAIAAVSGLTVNLEPFIGRMTHEALSELTSATRRGQVTGTFAGLQFAIEGRREVASRIAARGRLSLGGYRMNTEGLFDIVVPSSPASSRSDSFSERMSGFRASAEIGADFAVTPTLSFGVTAGLDHWTRMPSPRLSPFFAPIVFVGTDTRSHTDYFVGARLTLKDAVR
jgi:hypothetical protein